MPKARLAPASILLSAIVLAMCVALGCSAIVEPDVGSLGSPPAACSPGARAQCACEGGSVGSQVCNTGGSFEPCACGQAGSGG